MHRLIWVSLISLSAWAQNPAAQVPEEHIPPAIWAEMRALEHQFDMALARDCAPEKCVSKGCDYPTHKTVDLPANGSLPGLPTTTGPGSVPPQHYLTGAKCEFAYEKKWLSGAEADKLVRRLEQRLSRGTLTVKVSTLPLAPIPPSLAESPPLKPEEKPVVEEKKPELPVVPPAPEEWNAKVALRELWVNLLPHFSWMIAVVLGTVALLILIWALRRLGRESAQEKAMLAAMAAAPAAPEVPKADLIDPVATEITALPEPEPSNAFVLEQQKLWSERMAQAELAKKEGLIVGLLHHWLKKKEFALLAKAVFLFGDSLTEAFSSDPELAPLKVEFAEYLRGVDASSLPSDEDFFKKLNQHAVSSSILSQDDVETFQSLHREFGSSAMTGMMRHLPPRQGAVLFGLLPPELQGEVARTLAPELRVLVAQQLLSSNRASREERKFLFEALRAARAGEPLPQAPKSLPNELADRGSEFDAAGALSTLLPQIAPEARQALFGKVLERSNGALPRWYEDILYPDMLMKLPNEVQADLLLEVDMKGLAGWSSVQPPLWQDDFMNRISPSLQKALRANMAFASRESQMALAQQGRSELVDALKRRVARGMVSLPQLLS